MMFAKTILIIIGVRAPLDLGGAATLLPEKLHSGRKHVLYKTQTAVKAKTFTFLTSNERILIPKLLLEPPEETKIGSKSWIFQEI